MIFFIILPFLALGCVAFLFCVAVPPLRKFALGASLWCVACAPILLAIFIIGLLVTVGVNALHQVFNWNPAGMDMHFHQTSWMGWLLSAVVLTIVIAGATAITVLHGIILRRLTLALFRLYLTGVSFGVGVLTMFFISIVVDGLFLSATASRWLLLLLSINAASLIAAPALAYVCYKNARHFRGKYPERFPVVTQEEFS